MTTPVLSSDGVMDNPDNYPLMKRLLISRRASLIQQARALEIQRSAILGEVGEIEVALQIRKEKQVEYREDSNVSWAKGDR
jgi:hypothetical protein